MKHRSFLNASLAGCLAATFIGHAAQAASTPIGDPTYAWYLRETREFVVAPGRWDFHDFLVASGGRPGGTLARTYALGPTLFGTTALDAVAAFDDGHTFWASAQSPLLGGPGRDVVGGQAEIAEAQGRVGAVLAVRLRDVASAARSCSSSTSARAAATATAYTRT